MEWFKIYKMPDGKPANEFAFNSEPKNKEFAENIIAGCHESWKKLSRYSCEKDKKELYFDDPNTDVLFIHFISLVAATKRTVKGLL